MDKGLVNDELNSFGKFIVQQARTNLTKANYKKHKHGPIKDTGSLYNSIKYNVKVSKNSFEFSIDMEAYGKFVDKGVKGKTSSSKAPTSPFKFGSGSGMSGGLTKAIDAWVKRKHIQFRDKGGKFLSYKSTAMIITRSIYNTGLETTNFITRPIQLGFDKLSNDLTKAYGLVVDRFTNNILKNKNK